jgi:hypothetical protein
VVKTYSFDDTYMDGEETMLTTTAFIIVIVFLSGLYWNALISAKLRALKAVVERDNVEVALSASRAALRLAESELRSGQARSQLVEARVRLFKARLEQCLNYQEVRAALYSFYETVYVPLILGDSGEGEDEAPPQHATDPQIDALRARIDALNSVYEAVAGFLADAGYTMPFAAEGWTKATLYEAFGALLGERVEELARQEIADRRTDSPIPIV